MEETYYTAATIYACDRNDWTSEPCNWTGTNPSFDDDGAIVYCPKCEWMIS